MILCKRVRCREVSVLQAFRKRVPGHPRIRFGIAPGKPAHLIGSNNSGKSTVLEALALALNGGGFHQFVPEEFDFFHDRTGNALPDFTVTLYLQADDEKELPAVQGVGNPVRVHAIEVRGSTDAKGRFSHRRFLLDGDGKHILLSDRTPLKGAVKEEFKGAGLGYRRFYARIDDIRDHMPEVWLLSPQNLFRSLYEWRTGPLQRLSRMLAEKFFNTEWELDFEGKPRAMPATMFKAYKLFRESIEAFPFWQRALKPKLQDTLSQ